MLDRRLVSGVRLRRAELEQQLDAHAGRRRLVERPPEICGRRVERAARRGLGRRHTQDADDRCVGGRLGGEQVCGDLLRRRLLQGQEARRLRVPSRPVAGPEFPVHGRLEIGWTNASGRPRARMPAG